MFGRITEQTLKNLVAARQWQELLRVLLEAERTGALPVNVITYYRGMAQQQMGMTGAMIGGVPSMTHITQGMVPMMGQGMMQTSQVGYMAQPMTTQQVSYVSQPQVAQYTTQQVQNVITSAPQTSYIEKTEYIQQPPPIVVENVKRINQVQVQQPPLVQQVQVMVQGPPQINTEVRVVEKVVDRPVVEKVFQPPQIREIIQENVIDRPVYVPEFQPPQINEIIKENIIDRPVYVPEYQPPVYNEIIKQNFVDVPVYVPEYQPPQIREIINERVVDRPIYIEVEKRVELPVEKTLERTIERKVYVEKEVPYDKIVYVDKPVPYSVPSDPIFQTVEVDRFVDGNAFPAGFAQAGYAQSGLVQSGFAQTAYPVGVTNIGVSGVGMGPMAVSGVGMVGSPYGVTQVTTSRTNLVGAQPFMTIGNSLQNVARPFP